MVVNKLISDLVKPIRELLALIDPLGPPIERMEPHPIPWKEAVPQLVRAAVAKDIAVRTKNREGILNATHAIEAIIDDYCGTRPRKWPWPWPGPPPWTWEIASQLSVVANSLQPGSLRTEIEEIVTKVATRGNMTSRNE